MKVLMGTTQFKMTVEDEFVERLKSAATKTGRDSAQHLAEEIITIYLPVYIAVHDATRRAITYQSTTQAPEPQRHLAPVIAHIGSPRAEELSREQIQRTITTDEIAEAKRRTTPRKTQNVPVLKRTAK